MVGSEFPATRCRAYTPATSLGLSGCPQARGSTAIKSVINRIGGGANIGGLPRRVPRQDSPGATGWVTTARRICLTPKFSCKGFKQECGRQAARTSRSAPKNEWEKASLYADRHSENQIALRPPQLETECPLLHRCVFEVVRLPHAHELARCPGQLLRWGQIEPVFGQAPP